MWQYAGIAVVESPRIKVSLHDLTGFDGRCDAIYFSTECNDNLPQNKEEMEALRRRLLPGYGDPHDKGTFDLVVVGGGVAGMCAAVSAARLGLKVALVHDRPVLGGNNSSEVRVHLPDGGDSGRRHPRRHPARPGAAGCGRRQRLPGERDKGRVKLSERG